MFSIPPMPPWDGLHPLVVHFPIALIFVAPLFILLALLLKKHSGVLLVVGALMMLMAVAGAWVATSTGSAAEDFAEKVPGAKTILEEHEELGEAARNFATALAAVLVAAAGTFWKWGDKIPRGAVLAVGLAYLLAHGAGMLVVANAAHQGGRLVHEVGVRARLADGAPSNTIGAPATTPQKRVGGHDKND